MSRAKDHIASRVSDTDHYYLYAVEGGMDFADYIRVSDDVSLTQTGFKRLSMGEVASVQTRYATDHIERRIASMIESFSGQGEIAIDPLNDEFGDMTRQEQPRSQRYRDMAKIFSCHRLQHEEVFTSPITATSLPSGAVKVEPGTTRILFTNRPEKVDVMLTDHMGYTTGSTWHSIDDYEMTSYDGLNIGSYRYGEKDRDRWGFVNPKVFHKELIMDINQQFRIQDVVKPFMFYGDSDEVRVNGVPLCRKNAGRWEIIPYAEVA